MSDDSGDSSDERMRKRQDEDEDEEEDKKIEKGQENKQAEVKQPEPRQSEKTTPKIQMMVNPKPQVKSSRMIDEETLKKGLAPTKKTDEDEDQNINEMSMAMDSLNINDKSKPDNGLNKNASFKRNDQDNRNSYQEKRNFKPEKSFESRDNNPRDNDNSRREFRRPNNFRNKSGYQRNPEENNAPQRNFGGRPRYQNNNNNYFQRSNDRGFQQNDRGFDRGFDRGGFSQSFPQREPEQDHFFIKYESLINNLRNIYQIYKLTREEATKILKKLSMESGKTIFEAMNQITREAIIYNHLKSNPLKGWQADQRREIIEAIDRSTVSKEIREILFYYKVYTADSVGINRNVVKNAYIATKKEEERRKLEKNTSGFYNYIPLPVPENCGDLEELYAKNDNEINYHSLTYKTLLCRKQYCSEIFCPNSHKILEDFRIIYDYRDPRICLFMLELLKNKEILHIEDYLDHIDLPNAFSLSDFKVHKCQLYDEETQKSNCGFDSHLCLNYHGKSEQRRPPKLFNYYDKPCKSAYRDGQYNPKTCELGIFCPYIHSKYEFNYHENNFRKRFKCTRKKKNGKCIFLKTCYGVHKEKRGASLYEEVDEETMKKKRKLHDIEKKYKKEIKNLTTLYCPICASLPKNRKYVYFEKCKHITCSKCLSSVIKKKEKKCPICGCAFEKGDLAEINFGMKVKKASYSDSESGSHSDSGSDSD